MFPLTRLRRLRQFPGLRRLVQETSLSASHFIAPYFVVPGTGIKKPIRSMPGQHQFSIDSLLKDLEHLVKLRIPAVLLFGIPHKKDSTGTEAASPQGIIQRAVRAIKKHFPDLVVMTDLCLCEYTDHGHCGALRTSREGRTDVDNDATLALLEKVALAQAEAGSDVVAPSGMMDGVVKAVRRALDKRQFENTAIMAYSAKFASSFYGPFREAAQSTPQVGDRTTYQMNPSNLREALREVREDVKEGADLVMIKPALAYLDVISKVRQDVSCPVVAYNVSGEYAMVKAAEKLGWAGSRDNPRMAMEILTAIRRAGADLIISYHAVEIASLLSG